MDEMKTIPETEITAKAIPADSTIGIALILNWIERNPEHLGSIRTLLALKAEIGNEDAKIRQEEILKKVRNHLKRTLRKATDDIERFTIVSSLVRVGTIEDISLLLETMKKSENRNERLLFMAAIADIAARCCNIEINSLTEKMFLGRRKKEEEPALEPEHALEQG